MIDNTGEVSNTKKKYHTNEHKHTKAALVVLKINNHFCCSMTILRALFGSSSVLVRGRLVTGLVRRPLLNHSVMAERS